jgi:hypothetical protein
MTLRCTVMTNTTGNEEGQLDTELLVARCLAAISRKTQLEQRSMLTGTSTLIYFTFAYRLTHQSSALLHAITGVAHRGAMF